MKPNLGFFAGLSLGLDRCRTNADSKNILQFLSPEDRKKIVKLLNHHHNLFENLNNLYQAAGLKAELKPDVREHYVRLYGQFHQEIAKQQANFSTQQNLAARYERLFHKYDRKLKNPNLNDRQKARYQKLWIQYGILYAQYCHS